jgi:hypothetical protein
MLNHPLAKYNKALISVVGLAVTVLGVVFSDAAWLPPLVALLTSVGVYQAPNKA